MSSAAGSHGKRSSVGSNVRCAGNEARSSSEGAGGGGALPSSRFLELAQLGIYTEPAPMGEGGCGSVYRHDNVYCLPTSTLTGIACPAP